LITILIHTQEKLGTGGVTQVVQHLPTNHEALSSNPSTAKEDKLRNLFCWLIGIFPTQHNNKKKKKEEKRERSWI
jgi:hypothetical protein